MAPFCTSWLFLLQGPSVLLISCSQVKCSNRIKACTVEKRTPEELDNFDLALYRDYSNISYLQNCSYIYIKYLLSNVPNVVFGEVY